MDPLTQRFIGSIVRSLLLLFAGTFLDTSESEKFAEAGSIFAVTLGWSLYQKYKDSKTIKELKN